MRPLFFAFLLTFSPAALSAQTLTTRDIVSLTKAGLGEEVLVALIEVHRSVFPVDGDTLMMLKDAGVPQNVIVAMVRSGRDIPQPDPLPEPQEPVVVTRPTATPPQVVVIEHQSEDRHVREVAVPVAFPVYVPVRVHRPRSVEPIRQVEPVYWGFGGKLRPDAWTPSDSSHHNVRAGAISSNPFWLVEGPQKK